jgi:hypothetical protein
MKQFVLSVAVASALCSAGLLAANDDVRVRITGCVMDGDDNTFILTNVQEMQGGRMSPTTSIYWLSTTKGLKQQVGHKVEVSGTFSPSRDEGKTAKIKTESNGATGEQTVKIENGVKKAEATTGTTGSSATTVKSETTKPYRHLEVKSLKMLASTCK